MMPNLIQALINLISLFIQYILLAYIALSLVNIYAAVPKLAALGSIGGLASFLQSFMPSIPPVVSINISFMVMVICSAFCFRENIRIFLIGAITAQSIFLACHAASCSLHGMFAPPLPYGQTGISKLMHASLAEDTILIAILLCVIFLFKKHRTFIPLTSTVLLLRHHMMKSAGSSPAGSADKSGEDNSDIYSYTVSKFNLALLYILASIACFFSCPNHHDPLLSEYNLYLIISSLAILFLTVCNIYMLKASIIGINNHLKYLEQDKLHADILNMDKTLRAQRHDFMNHMQVVYGLMKMARFDNAKSYIAKLYGEITDTNSAISTGITELNALLLSKAEAAKSAGVTLTFSISTTLLGVPIPPFELTKVIGNLVDNALYAAARSEDERKIQISIYESLGQFMFSITNTGSCIDPAIQDKIFLPGFSTKNRNGEGLGLYIVKSILDKYNSRIYCKSTVQDGTCFTIIFSRGAGNESSM